MAADNRVKGYFDRTASRFDAIYSGEAGVLGRAWDAAFRRTVYWRHAFTLQMAAPLAHLRVLDVGCGSGRLCTDLARQGAREVVGIDISAVMLTLAERLSRVENVDQTCKFQLVDVTTYAPEHPFDLVIALGFFDYVADPVETMAHLRTLCAAKLIAAFPGRYSPRAPLRKFWHTAHHSYVRYYTGNGILRLCQATGFEVVRLIKRGPMYMLIAEPR